MKRIICILLTLVSVIMILPTGVIAEETETESEAWPFPDVPPNAWYTEYIVKAHELGLIQGNDTGNMMPTKPLTRAEAVTLIRNQCNKVYDYPEVTEIPFTDVKKNDWFYEAVKWAYCENVVQGIGNNRFKPNDYVTRQDFAVMICNYYGLSGLTEDDQCGFNWDAEQSDWCYHEFADIDLVADYALDSIKCLTTSIGRVYSEYSPCYKPIMLGSNNYFMPLKNCTRVEAIKTVYMLIRDDPIENPFTTFPYRRYYDIPLNSILGDFLYHGLEYQCLLEEWNVEESKLVLPNKPITRREMCELLLYSVDVPAYNYYSFEDSNNNYMEYAYQQGYILANNDKMRPEDYATKEELIYFLYKLNKSKKYESENTDKYADFKEVSNEYISSVKWFICMVEQRAPKHPFQKIISSNGGQIEPKAFATRKDLIIISEFRHQSADQP